MKQSAQRTQQALGHGGIWKQCPPAIFCSPQILLFPEKFVLNTIKNKHLAPPKNTFPLQTLIPGYGPGMQERNYSDIMRFHDCYFATDPHCLVDSIWKRKKVINLRQPAKYALKTSGGLHFW